MFPPWKRRVVEITDLVVRREEGGNGGWTLNITMATRSCRDPYPAPYCKAPSRFGIRSLLWITDLDESFLSRRLQLRSLLRLFYDFHTNLTLLIKVKNTIPAKYTISSDYFVNCINAKTCWNYLSNSIKLFCSFVKTSL